MPKPGPRTTYKYSDEFKATAVRLSQLSNDTQSYAIRRHPDLRTTGRGK